MMTNKPISEFAIGMRVRILFGEVHGQFGTIYDHREGHPAPWLVRPDVRPLGWTPDGAGIALMSHEISAVESEQAEVIHG